MKQDFLWDSSILCKVLLEWKNENFHSDGSFLEWNMISFKQKLFFCGTEQSEGIIGLDHERKEKRFMGINWKNKIRKIIAEGVWAGVLLLLAGLPQTGQELPRTEPSVESQTEEELPDGDDKGIMPCGDLSLIHI